MIPNATNRHTVTKGEKSKVFFGISEENQAHLISILRDELYSNKEMAVLREYASNAWDAHVEAGIPDRPIHITLPTNLAHVLKIRDWGLGLSKEDIEHVYSKYGASGKRDTNGQVGSFGIGCKSGFAYNDTFTITSWHGGVKRIFVAYLDETEVGAVQLMHEEGGIGDETGVEIQVPVNPKDTFLFKKEASKLFPFFSPVPTINLPVEPLIEDRTGSGFLVRTPVEGLSSWVGVMGCVPYPIDWEAFRGMPEYVNSMSNFVNNLRGGLYFPVGSVDPTPNREGLAYTAKTKTAVLRTLNAFMEEMEARIIDILDSTAVNNFQKRLEAKRFSQNTGLSSLNKKLSTLSESTAYPFEFTFFTGTGKSCQHWNIKPLSFSVHKRTYSKNSEICYDLPIQETSHLIILDMNKHPGGYLDRDGPGRTVKPRAGFTIEQVQLELDMFLQASKVDGIPTYLASTKTYVPVSEAKVLNPKYRSKVFSRNYLTNGFGSNSTNWQTCDRDLQESDPVVALKRFKPMGTSDNRIRHAVKNLKRITPFNGVVYGVRSSHKKPVTAASSGGTYFWAWLKSQIEEAIEASPELRSGFSAFSWRETTSVHKNTFVEFRSALNATHPFSMYLEACTKKGEEYQTRYISKKDVFTWIQKEDLYTGPDSPEEALKLLSEKYPLLAKHCLCTNYLELKPEEVKHWVTYIKACDASRVLGI